MRRFLSVLLIAFLAACGGGGGSEQTPGLSRLASLGSAKAEGPVVELSAEVVSVVGLTKLSERRISRTVFEYGYRVTVQNREGPLAGLVANLLSGGPGTSVVEGIVTIGDMSASSSLTPGDTVTIRHDRSLPFDQSALLWSISGQILPPALLDQTIAVPTSLNPVVALGSGESIDLSDAPELMGSSLKLSKVQSDWIESILRSSADELGVRAIDQDSFSITSSREPASGRIRLRATIPLSSLAIQPDELPAFFVLTGPNGENGEDGEESLEALNSETDLDTGVVTALLDSRFLQEQADGTFVAKLKIGLLRLAPVSASSGSAGLRKQRMAVSAPRDRVACPVSPCVETSQFNPNRVLRIKDTTPQKFEKSPHFGIDLRAQMPDAVSGVSGTTVAFVRDNATYVAEINKLSDATLSACNSKPAATKTRCNLSDTDKVACPKRKDVNLSVARFTSAFQAQCGAGRSVSLERGALLYKYFHLSSVEAGLGVGSMVSKPATNIGVAGDSGRPKGSPHLHFETLVETTLCSNRSGSQQGCRTSKKGTQRLDPFNFLVNKFEYTAPSGGTATVSQATPVNFSLQAKDVEDQVVSSAVGKAINANPGDPERFICLSQSKKLLQLPLSPPSSPNINGAVCLPWGSTFSAGTPTADSTLVTARYTGNTFGQLDPNTRIATAQVTVGIDGLVLELTPVKASVEKGATLQLIVTAKDSRGNTVPTPTGLRWTADSKVSIDQSGVVTGILAGDAVVQVTDPASKATAQVTVNVYGTHAFIYFVAIRSIPCSGSVFLNYTLDGGGDSRGETFTYNAVPCVPVAFDDFFPRLSVPINLRASTEYTLTMTVGGDFSPSFTNAFVEFDSTSVGFSGFVKSAIGIPGTYTKVFTTPP